ncbi:MAG TPA: uroporphyrinogen decarboxylase family protein [Clostridiales bacterium]|nr:uroporphyrinogen decarboxylase family protein [Clostridiales bacterium]
MKKWSNEKMTERKRYIETLLFGNPDKIPLQPGVPRESTLAAWHKQGLPEGVNYFDALMDILGIPNPPAPKKTYLTVDFKMIPQFEEKVLEHKDGHYIVQDWMGAITEISDEFDYTYIRAAKDFVTRKWHKFPVQSREDWEEMKKRYNADSPERLTENLDEICGKLQDRDYVAGISFNGPFWQLREWLGFENLCIKFIEEPEFIHEMIEFWTEFISRLLARFINKMELDKVHISEDMAYKAHSMISPAMTREFLMPSYIRWVKEIKASGCSIIDMDSDGYIGELIPIWIESGINACDPIEVAAHNDIVEYRRVFGKSMAYTGGIDKRAIAKGGKDMFNEVMRVVPPLLKDGGFIPGCDHGVPPDISWPDFIEYTRLLAKLTGWL